MYKYTIKEKTEDFLDTVITKENMTADFTLREVEAEANRLKKALKELKARSQLENAKITNIETHHPAVKDMGDEERFTIHMYQEAKSVVKVADAKIEEIERALKNYAGELDEIHNQLGLKISIEENADNKENKQEESK